MLKKAIIPAGGLSTRFLPISKIVSKEFLPLVDAPLLDYAVREAKDSEIQQIVFVIGQNKKAILDYFKKSPKLENLLRERGQKESLKELKKINDDFAGLSLSCVLQEKPLGDGDAVLHARNAVRKESTAVLFPDDIIDAKKPALSQLLAVFKTCQKPVVGLKKVPQDKLSHYGVVRVEKIATRLYKIKEIVEKPKGEKEAPSDLAVVGRYILTPDVFDFLGKVKPNRKGEIILAEAFQLMLSQGKLIYGCEIEGEWLECGTKADWLKANLYFALRHPVYGPELKQELKKLI